MERFKINIDGLHFIITARLSNDTISYCDFNPVDKENPTSYEVVLSYITPTLGDNALFPIIGILGAASLFLTYKFPAIGGLASALYIQHVKGLLVSYDGFGMVTCGATHTDDLNILSNNALELPVEAEAKLINFLEMEMSNPHHYNMFEYNCATFAKEAFCIAYPDKCPDFKAMIMDQVYENPSFLNLISVTFLNTFNLLD